MINEYLFFTQVVIVALICACCSRLGSGALTSWLCIQSILANLLVLKMVGLFGLDVTAADAFSIGSLYCLNILRENHGQKSAQVAVVSSFFLLLATAVLFIIHLAFIPSATDKISVQYTEVFGKIIPIMGVSGCIFSLVQIMDYILFGYFQRKIGNYSLAFRIFLSIVCTQVFDTALFTYWALGGWISTFWHVFIWSYVLKVMITLLLAVSSCEKSLKKRVVNRFIHYVQV